MNAFYLKTLSDEELIELKDELYSQVFAELYNRYISNIIITCYKFTKSTNEAQDIAHDIFVKIMEKLPMFKGASLLKTWIFAITNNHCISYMYKKKKHFFTTIENMVIEDDNESVLNDIEAEESQIIQLKKLLASLSIEENKILQLKYNEKRSILFIQHEMNLSESAVKMKLHRSRKKLESKFKRA